VERESEEGEDLNEEEDLNKAVDGETGEENTNGSIVHEGFLKR